MNIEPGKAIVWWRTVGAPENLVYPMLARIVRQTSPNRITIRVWDEKAEVWAPRLTSIHPGSCSEPSREREALVPALLGDG